MTSVIQNSRGEDPASTSAAGSGLIRRHSQFRKQQTLIYDLPVH